MLEIQVPETSARPLALRLLAARTVRARLAAFAIACVLVELVTRSTVWWQRTIYEPGIGYVLAPGAWMWGREGWAISCWEEHGVRCAPAAAADAIPVLVAGDSFTEAVHVGDEDTFPYRADVLLSEGASRDVKVLAVGRSGASLPDYILNAPRWEELFHPAVVVVVVADGDFTHDAWSRGKAHFVDEGGVVRVEPVGGEAYHGVRRALWYVRQHSMALGIAQARWREYGNGLKQETPLFRAGEAAERAAKKKVAHPVEPQLRALAATYGPRLVVVHLPKLEPEAPREATPVERELFAACEQVGVACVSTREALAAEMLSSRASPFGLGGDRFGEGHLNPRGHAVVAAELARALRATLDAREAGH